MYILTYSLAEEGVRGESERERVSVMYLLTAHFHCRK